MMVYQGISQPIRAFRRAMSACGARVELDDRPCECLTGREDVAAGVGVVAGASGDEDAVGEGNGLSGGCQEEGDQKGRDGEKNPAGKTHGKPPYYSFLVRAAYSNAVKGSERAASLRRVKIPRASNCGLGRGSKGSRRPGARGTPGRHSRSDPVLGHQRRYRVRLLGWRGAREPPDEGDPQSGPCPEGDRARVLTRYPEHGGARAFAALERPGYRLFVRGHRP